MKKNLTHRVAPVEDLFAALLQLKSPRQMALFMDDLCTPTELAAMADRWHAARLLAQGFSQRDVAARTCVALGTVTRVARSLKNSHGGYKSLLSAIQAAPVGQTA